MKPLIGRILKAVFLLLLCAAQSPQAHAALSIGVHGKTSTDTGTTSVVTINTQSSGSLIVLGMTYDATFTSIADSNSNSWTQLGSEVANSGLRHRMYYKENAVGGTSHSFTLTTSSGGIRTLIVLEILGAVTSGSLDTNPGGNQDGASPYTSLSTGTLAQAAEIVVAGISADSNGSFSESTGFTIVEQETGGGMYYPGALAYKIVSATTAQQASFTLAGSSQGLLHIASFKEAAGGGSALPVIIQQQSMNAANDDEYELVANSRF